MSAVQCPVLPDQRTRRTSEYVALRQKYVTLPVKKIIVFGPIKNDMYAHLIFSIRPNERLSFSPNFSIACGGL